MTTRDGRQFCREVYEAAKAGDISPLFITAQACLETGWGQYRIGNNIFGITKGSTWAGDTVLATTTEYFANNRVTFKSPEQVISITKLAPKKYKYRVKRLFRSYKTLSECIIDHEQLFKKRIYADAWEYRNNPKEFARRISDNVGGKYATAPDYARVMAAMIDSVEREIK